MVKSAHMVITDWGSDLAYSVSSHDLPGIVAAYDDFPSPTEVYKLARAAGLDEDGEVISYREVACEQDGITSFFRCPLDAQVFKRFAAIDKLRDNKDLAYETFKTLEADDHGDYYTIAALMDDRILAIIGAYEEGARFNIAVINDDNVMMIGINHTPSPEQISISDLGLGKDATFWDLYSDATRSRLGGAEVKELAMV